MEKLIAVLLGLALSSTICAAQQSPTAHVNSQATAHESPAKSAQTPASPGQQEQSAQTSNSAQPQTISGCLHQSGTAYTLTDSQTGTVYKLTGDTSHLSPHVGHEMQITGQTKSGVSQNAAGAPSGNSGKPYVFEVSAAKHLADQCGPSRTTANGPSL
jgi:hypothetical protein